jgi:hypothetical protein
MQAAAFYVEAVQSGRVWTVRDAGGYPAPRTMSGARAQPFWSLRSRAERVVGNVPAYAGFDVEEIALEEFRQGWLPGLQNDGIRVGLNWFGPQATGYDLLGAEVEANLAAVEREPKTD